MKYMSVKERYMSLNLQLFAEDVDSGDETGEGDDPDGEEDPDEDGDDGEDEKTYTQKEIDDMMKKRLSREKRRWQREQKTTNPKLTNPKPKDSKPNEQEEDKETTELREKAQKVEDLELKWTCLEHDVKKDCVDDVLALAKVHASKKDVDIEDAIDDIVKKYPQFKDSEDPEEESSTEGKKGWGQRHGKNPKGTSTVDDEIRKQLFGK